MNAHSLNRLLAFLALLPMALAQQDKGTVAGTITDPAKAAIVGAEVTIRNLATGERRTMNSLGGGEFVFPALQVGTYEIAVKAAGFATAVRKDLVVQVQQRLDLDISLEVATQLNEIRVTAEAPVLQTADSSLGQVVNSNEIVAMPLNGRDIYQLVALTPGVVTEADGMAALSGQPGQQQGYVIDGVDNNNYQIIYTGKSASTVGPSPDAIEEFKVQTGNYSAEFGQAGGGVVNVITKSGTNNLHGTLYEFLRNDKFDARNFFATSNPPFKQNQYGFTVGGPAYLPKIFDGRNKLFFFADYEAFKQRTVNVVDTAIPSLAHRQGNFSDLLTGQTFTDSCTGQTFDTGQLFDPTTTRAVTCADGSTGFERDPISYNGQLNVIDPSKIVKPAATTMSLLPAPNQGPNGFYWTPGTAYNSTKIDTKIDFQLSSKDHIAVRYNYSHVPPYGAPFIPGAASANTLNDSQTFAGGVSETHVFSPTLLNDLRYGYQHTIGVVGLADPNLDPASLGYGGTIFSKGLLGGIPTLNISDAGLGLGAPGWSPFLLTGHASNVLDTLTLVRGRHTFKFGGSINHNGSAQFMSPAPMGSYTFTGVLTSNLNAPSGVNNGSGLAQFLFGIPDSVQLSNATLSELDRFSAAAFVQDDWRVSERLTVNLGLRWEGGSTPHERYDRMTGVDLATGAFVIPDSRKNIPPFISPAFKVEYTSDPTLMLASNLNFGPRVGFAYRLTQKTVVRSAFGMYFANPYEEGSTGYNLNPPWGSQVNVTTPPTGPIDPVTHQAVSPVTNITTGFTNAQAALENLLGTSSLSLFDLKGFVPYTLNWSFALQQQLPWNTAIETAYNGTKGTHLLTGWDPNQSYPSADPNSPPASRRPYPELGMLTYIGGDANSQYNALQVKIEKRLSNGLMFNVGYTWSHSIDEAPLCTMAGNQGFGDCFRDGHDRNIDRGNSGFDVRQRLTTSWQYDLPFGRSRKFGSNWNGPVNTILGGWELTGIHSFQTGTHFTINSWYDPANSPTYSGIARASVVGNPWDFSYGQTQQAAAGCPVGHQSVECWFNPAAFTLATAGQFGDAGRNIMTAPGIISVDLGLYKTFLLHEGVHLTFRGEFFNAINHANFGFPGQEVDDPSNFAIIRSAGAPRQIQLALKLAY